jgi:hypothetical protein
MDARPDRAGGSVIADGTQQKGRRLDSEEALARQTLGKGPRIELKPKPSVAERRLKES